MAKLFDFQLVFTRMPAILSYLPVTLELVLLSTLFSLIIGAIVALIKINRVPVLRQIAAFYVSFARGTPSIVQLYLIFYGFPMALQAMNLYWGTHFNTAAPSMVCAVIAFTFNEGAYASENIRAALESVDRGQREAALSIGMTPLQAFSASSCPRPWWWPCRRLAIPSSDPSKTRRWPSPAPWWR